MQTQIGLHTRVAFKRDFLRSTGQFTGWAPFARGEVIAMRATPRGVPGVLTIRWDDGTRSRVLVSNLVREDRIHLEPV